MTEGHGKRIRLNLRGVLGSRPAENAPLSRGSAPRTVREQGLRLAATGPEVVAVERITLP
jgi:hypothetical protein